MEIGKVHKIVQIVATAPMQMFSRIALASLWALFAIAHITTFRATDRPSLLLFAIAETLIAVFFLLRTRARSVTTAPHEWIAAVLGTFLPLLLRPAGDNPFPTAEWGLMIGSAMQISGVISLNRSLAIVPALRELKTDGMYRFVRHPIYFSYLVTFFFYLATNFSTGNLLIVLCSVCLLVARVRFEERHLCQTPEYCAYRARVRWRIIPFVF